MGCALNSGYFLVRTIPNPFDQLEVPLLERPVRRRASVGGRVQPSIRRPGSSVISPADKIGRRRLRPTKRKTSPVANIESGKAQEYKMRQNLFYDSWIEIREAIQGGLPKNRRDGFNLSHPEEGESVNFYLGGDENDPRGVNRGQSVGSPSKLMRSPGRLGEGFKEVSLSSWSPATKLGLGRSCRPRGYGRKLRLRKKQVPNLWDDLFGDLVEKKSSPPPPNSPPPCPPWAPGNNNLKTSVEEKKPESKNINSPPILDIRADVDYPVKPKPQTDRSTIPSLATTTDTTKRNEVPQAPSVTGSFTPAPALAIPEEDVKAPILETPTTPRAPAVSMVETIPPPPGFLVDGLIAPPPFMDGIAPPPIFGAVGEQKKSGKTPKLKKLHWTPLRKVKEGSIWCRIAEEEESETLGTGTTLPSISGLEECFKQESERKKRRKSVGGAKKRPKTKLVCIDDRRACNVNIGLAGIKKSPAEIAAAVTNLDGENLGSDALGRLVKIFPTMEELKKLRRFKGDKNQLDRAEKFFLAISSIAQPHARLQILLLISEFPSRVSSILSRLQQLKKANSALRGSKALKSVLKVVLQAGNQMNEGRAVGGAQGFRLVTLQTLKSVKGQDRKTSLLHLIVKHLLQSNEQIIHEFLTDLSHVHGATRVDEAGLRLDVSFVSSNLQFLKECLRMLTSAPKKAQIFYASASKKWEMVLKDRDHTLQDFMLTLEYFGEADGDLAGPEQWKDFFMLWQRFAGEFKYEVLSIQKKAKADARRRMSLSTRKKRKKVTRSSLFP